jgi:hypothetical protein
LIPPVKCGRKLGALVFDEKLSGELFDFTGEAS